MKIYISLFLAFLLSLVLIGCKETPPAESTYRVEFTFTMLSNDSVGNEWQTVVTYKNKIIQSGDSITAPPDADIVLLGEVTEVDAVSDVGRGVVCLKPDNFASGETEIIVSENRGMYSGNTASWRLCCSVTRVSS